MGDLSAVWARSDGSLWNAWTAVVCSECQIMPIAVPIVRDKSWPPTSSRHRMAVVVSAAQHRRRGTSCIICYTTVDIVRFRRPRADLPSAAAKQSPRPTWSSKQSSKTSPPNNASSVSSTERPTRGAYSQAIRRALGSRTLRRVVRRIG